MQATRLALVLVAFGAACRSSSPEPAPAPTGSFRDLPDLAVSASCLRVEDMKRLAVAVSNLGNLTAARSATRVEFDGDPTESIIRTTRPVKVRAVETFEVEVPAECLRTHCNWKILADDANQVPESDETNNTSDGHC